MSRRWTSAQGNQDRDDCTSSETVAANKASEGRPAGPSTVVEAQMAEHGDDESLEEQVPSKLSGT